MADHDDRYDDSVDDDGFGTFASGDDGAAGDPFADDAGATASVSRPSVWAAAAGEQLDELDDPWGPQGTGSSSLGSGQTLDVGPPSGSVELPDWKDPPTGQVPRVVLGDDEEGWAARTGSQPSWRGDDDWASPDFDDGLLDDDTGEVAVGALDSNRPEMSSAFTFDDMPSGEQPVIQIGADDAAPPGTAGATTVAPIRSRARTDDDGPTAAPPGGAGGRDMPVAILVGAGFALAAVFAFAIFDLIGPFVLATLVVLVCAQELFAAFQRGGLRPATLLGLTACAALMWGTYARGVGAIPLILVLTFVGSMLWYLAKVIHARPILGVGTTLLGVVWVGVLGSYAALLLPLEDGAGHNVGKSWLLAAIICTVVADVVALAGGSAFGHTPLAPDASPNKTWEGALAGFLGAVIAGAAVGAFDSGVGTGKGVILGIAVGVIAPVGDLCQSLVKRDLGIKDMGSALPGHGGFLDRFDSLLFVLPAAFYIATRYYGG
jgi:phosphatidate cytidylyltransferase